MLREVGKHPDDDEPIQVIDGRYGPYLKHGATNAPLPKGVETDAVTMQQAIEAIAARAKTGGKGKKKAAPKAKKAAAPKAEKPAAKPKAKKAAAKKAAPKKATGGKKAAAA